MKTGLVITTINKINKNLKNIDLQTKINNWDFNVIGDKKTPKQFTLRYGNYLNINSQKKLNFKFSKICPLNSYARKNIGYLLLAKNKNDFINDIASFNSYSSIESKLFKLSKCLLPINN